MPLEFATTGFDLVRRLREAESLSESVYLKLGGLFPELEAELGRSGVGAEAVIRNFSGFTEGREGETLGKLAERLVKSLKEEAASSREFLSRLLERDDAFLAGINESIALLGGLDALIARVRADSEEIEIVSLNAMTVAFKSGADGKAFSVITDELKRLSGRTISLTEDIGKGGHTLMDRFEGLKSALGSMDAVQKEYFARLGERLDSGFSDLSLGMKDSLAGFQRIVREAGQVREPVMALMQEIQLQDIVRQSLDHVVISLEEASRAAAAAVPDAAYVLGLVDLAQNLVEDVEDKLSASAASFESGLARVEAVVAACEEDRDAFLSSARARELTDERPMDLARATARYNAIKRKVLEETARLEIQVRDLDERFSLLARLLGRFQNIVTASRIEVSKTRALIVVTTTVEAMMALTEALGRDVGESTNSIKAFIKFVGASARGYEAAQEEASARLADTVFAMGRDLGSLAEAKARIGQAIEGFRPYTEGFIGLLGATREELARLASLATALRSLREDLGSAREGLAVETAGRRMDEGKAATLREMMERFTIFTHKRAAGAIGDIEVDSESGAEAGDVTLF